MIAEIVWDQDDPNYNDWYAKNEEKQLQETTWHRLSNLVLFNTFQETGAFDQLGKHDKARLNRRLDFAVDPNNLTDTDHKQRKPLMIGPYLPARIVPLIPFIYAGAGAMGLVESYSKTRIPGHSAAKKIIDKFNLDEQYSYAIGYSETEITRQLLLPEILAGIVAADASFKYGEPWDVVVNMEELLASYESAIDPSGTNLEDTFHSLKVFTDKSPKTFTPEELRRNAARVFMKSGLLQNGEIRRISLDTRLTYLPDGPNTFRMNITKPFAHLYDHEELARHRQQEIKHNNDSSLSIYRKMENVSKLILE